MSLIRFKDWEQRLTDYFAATAKRPFDWGTNDCALWACAGIEAMTGRDPAAPFKGDAGPAYDSQMGAARAMLAFAGGGLAEVADRIAADFGSPEVAPLYAGRGDLVLFAGALGPTLGLVSLDGWQVFAAGPEGRCKVRLRALAGDARAWRIG